MSMRPLQAFPEWHGSTPSPESWSSSAFEGVSRSIRTLFAIAPPVDGLDIVGMIVSPRSSHSSRIDVVRHNIGVVGEPSSAKYTDTILRCNLSVHQFPHLGVRADLPITARVLRIIHATDAHLVRSSFLRNGFSSAARKRTMNWTELISAESHKFLQHQIEFLWIGYGFF